MIEFLTSPNATLLLLIVVAWCLNRAFKQLETIIWIINQNAINTQAHIDKMRGWTDMAANHINTTMIQNQTMMSSLDRLGTILYNETTNDDLKKAMDVNFPKVDFTANYGLYDWRQADAGKETGQDNS